MGLRKFEDNPLIYPFYIIPYYRKIENLISRFIIYLKYKYLRRSRPFTTTNHADREQNPVALHRSVLDLRVQSDHRVHEDRSPRCGDDRSHVAQAQHGYYE